MGRECIGVKKKNIGMHAEPNLDGIIIDESTPKGPNTLG